MLVKGTAPKSSDVALPGVNAGPFESTTYEVVNTAQKFDFTLRYAILGLLHRSHFLGMFNKL